MKSWFFQTNRSLGQVDAQDIAEVKRILKRLACPTAEIKTAEIWEALPNAKKPSFPIAKEGK